MNHLDSAGVSLYTTCKLMPVVQQSKYEANWSVGGGGQQETFWHVDESISAVRVSLFSIMKTQRVKEGSGEMGK